MDGRLPDLTGRKVEGLVEARIAGAQAEDEYGSAAGEDLLIRVFLEHMGCLPGFRVWHIAGLS